MASPTSNSLWTTYFDPASTGLGKYVSAGVKWGGGLGTGATITFSFPTSSASHISGYGNGEYSGVSGLTNADKAAVRATLAAWSSVANIKFVEVADNSTTVGELRFAYSTAMDAGEAAHAYYPGDYVEAGDVWISKSNWNTDHATTIAPGSFDFHTLLHEIGHALGLKHSFETPNAIPSNLDNYLYSVMSYTASPWSDTNDSYSSFAPTTPMYYDLLAIQAMYGSATSVNASNTTYTFTDGKKYWQAINDTGGTDTIVYSGSESSTINLNPGQLSALSEAIEFWSGKTTRATVTIGPNVVIENATGGSGNDTLTGNSANNVLNGGSGNDTMTGGAGNDTYYVGASSDKAVEASNAGTDRVYSTVTYTLAANVENLTLTGSSTINGIGNTLGNALTGNSAANSLSGQVGVDVLAGGLGSDTLTGGADGDFFVFNTTPNTSTNRDWITDFTSADTIRLENAIFTAFASVAANTAISSAAFWNASGAVAAHDLDDRIIYNTATGNLYYDADGNKAGGVAAIQFATLTTHPGLTYADFHII